MFRAVLFTQWLSSRLLLASCMIAAFTIPILAVQGAVGGRTPAVASGGAAGLGAVHRHVAPHSRRGDGSRARRRRVGRRPPRRTRVCPVAADPPARYVLLRYGAGAAMLAGPVIMVWIGSLVALSAAAIPPGLHGYPHLLAFRFLLATLLAYSTFFAIAASTPRTASIILAGAIGLVAIQLIAFSFGAPNLLGPLVEGLFYSPGPLDVFGGNWMLIECLTAG